MSNVKLSEEQIKSVIVLDEYVKMGKKTVICLATLKNGFELVGVGSCVDPANFNEELGKQYACEDAEKKSIAKLWELEGYRLVMSLK